MTSRTLSLLFVLLLATCCAAIADEGHHHEMTQQELGSVSFAISCAPEVQKPFEIGIAWLYSFEYEPANIQFKEVAQKDPSCAMAYWGQAMTLYHQLWSRPPRDDVHRGAELLEKARSLKPKTQRERDYIDALAIFYSADDPDHYKQRVEGYSAAMDKLRQSNPQDREAAVFYALSLLALSNEERDPELTLERKAVEVLNAELKGAPNHPGIMHYIIHATDNPQLAPMGLEAARAYAKVAPASTHATHMPSHIFARLGLWQDDIRSNVAAIAIADQMPGEHTAHHRLHSMDFLLSAYLQIGDDRNAKAQIDALAQLPKHAMMPSYEEYYQTAQFMFPAVYALERRQWKDAVAIKADPSMPPYVQAVAYWSQAVGAGYLHDAATARAAADRVKAMVEATRKSDKPEMAADLERPLQEAQAWALHAEGKDDDAVNLLRTAADLEDKVGKGETELPAREMLADLLMQMGRAEDALKEYETSLKVNPNRFNALNGAGRAAEAAHQKQKAVEYYSQLVKNCIPDSDRAELVQARSFVASASKSDAPAYDAELAKKLGADDMGMKHYVLVILKTGPNDATVKGKERDDIFAGHMANIGRLAEEGKMAVAGPFGKNDLGFRGLFILNAADVDEARKLAETDPAIKAGIFVVDLIPWYGSAALMETLEIHKKISKPQP